MNDQKDTSVTRLINRSETDGAAAEKPANSVPNKHVEKAHSSSNRWPWILLSVVVLLGVILVLAPIGMRYGAEQWLLDEGLDQAQIQDVDFNVFTGELIVNGLSTELEEGTVLEVASASVLVDWAPLFNQQVWIDFIELADAVIVIKQDQSGLVHAGGLAGSGDSGDVKASSWDVGVGRISITNTLIQYRSPDLSRDLQLDSLTLGAYVPWQPEQAISLNMVGALNGSPMTMDLELLAEPVALSGSISTQDIDLSVFSSLIGEQAGLLAGALSANLKVDFKQSSEGVWSSTQSGDLKLTDLSLTPADQDFNFQIGAIEWVGDSAAEDPGEGTQVSATGRLSIQKVVETDTREDRVRSQIAGAVIESVVVSKDGAVTMLKITSEDIQAGSAKKASEQLVSLAKFQLDTLSRTADGAIALGQIEISGLNSFVLRDKAGEMPQIAEFTSSSDKAESDTKEDGGVALKIAGVVLNDAKVNFRDNSVKPAYKETLVIDKLDMGAINSATPAKAAALKASGRIGKHATLKVNGKIAALADPLALDLKTDINAMELPPLSSYTRGVLGHILKSGQMNISTDLKIADGKFDGENKLKLSKVEVEKLPADKISKDAASVPLDTGLSMLKDKNDDIELSIPLKGTTDDPQFDFSDAIRQAMTKAMASASLTYLKYSLQPYGALLVLSDLVSKAGEASAAASLQPIPFKPQSAEFDSSAHDYLAKISSLLIERPKMRLTVCGIVVETERQLIPEKSADPKAKPVELPPALTDDAMLSLAEKRGHVVKSYLLGNAEIKADRLFSCHPAISTEEDAAPSVKMSL